MRNPSGDTGETGGDWASDGGTDGFRARFFDSHAPLGEDARVRLAGGSLLIRTAACEAEWPLDDVRQTRGEVRGEPVHLERAGSNAVVVCSDPAIVVAIQSARPDLAKRFRRPGNSFGVRVAAAAVLTVLVVVVLVRLGIPAIAGALAGWVPIEWEERFGAMVVQQLEAGEGRRVTDPRVTGAVERIVARLVETEPRSPYRYRVIVLERDDVNALAAPGGHIVVFSGLIRAVESPEALAGVLAHEMEHVAARHVTKSMFADASFGFLVAAALGNTSGSSVASVARTLGRLSYSREAEIEADEGGLRRLVAARVDPRALPRFLERMRGEAGESRWASFLSTHPAPADRVARLRGRIAALAGGEAVPLLDKETWDATRTAVRDSTR